MTDHFKELEAAVRSQMKNETLRGEVFDIVALKVLQSMVAHSPKSMPWNKNPSPISSSEMVFHDSIIKSVANVVSDELSKKPTNRRT